jgi:membrane protease YdiL (CAAX protease family)
MGLSSVLLFGLLLGLGAAAGEETLFRGALQPVFGVVLTSLLFASLHVQYGPSVSLGYVFLLSVGLGILRNRINTTAAFVAHAGYNFSGVLLAYLLGGV